MKKILVFLLLSIVSIQSFAQYDDSLPSWWNEQKKDEVVDSGTISPSTRPSINSNNILGSFAQNAIFTELSLIRQQFVVSRDGQSYGRDGKPFYGESYSLGIKVLGGMFLLESAVEPWNSDDAYKRLNADGKYTPELYWSFQRPIDGGEYKKVYLDQGTPYNAPANGDKSLYLKVDALNDFGLDIDATTGQKQGTMIWATASTNVQDSAMVVQLASKSMTINADGKKTLIGAAPDNAEKTIGGLFVVPKYERGGRVQFLLAGVAVKTAEGKWALQLLTSAAEAASADTPKEGKPQEKKDDNNDPNDLGLTPVKKK